MILACGSKDSKQDNPQESKNSTETTSEKQELSIKTDGQFGEEFESADVKTDSEMLALFKELSLGDTIQVQFQSKVQGVCAKKGCWMKLELPQEQNTHITFKNYSFFVPKDSKGRKMQVNGVAFIEQTDIQTLKHYAEDAGESKEKIARITEPKLNYRFIANGVKVVE